MVYRSLYCVLNLIPAKQFQQNALQIINCEQRWYEMT